MTDKPLGKGNRSDKRGHRTPKAEAEKYISFRATLPPLIYAAIELAQDGDEPFSQTLARLLSGHPIVAAHMALLERAQSHDQS